KSSSVSSPMRKKKQAALHYAIAYCKVKQHQSSKFLQDASLLTEALDEIKQCIALDSGHYKAKRAEKRIGEGIPQKSKRLAEEIGRYTIAAGSFLVFVLAQISFWRGGRIKDLAPFVSLTFGSLVMVIVGLYLPQILKLKV